MEDYIYELTLQESISRLHEIGSICDRESYSNAFIYNDIDRSNSDLDAWDFCFSLAIGMAGARITTSEEMEIYLNDIHHAASGATGDYSKLQEFLGALFHHQGDAIDKLSTQKHFINRAYEPADIGYHRLLWGHDIFDITEDNPFYLMINQQGVSGVLQAIRHLIADTTSKQGLPLPGSSYLDYYKDNGKISNYIINIAKGLSQETVGNMRNAQSIYSHMFTVRAQDILGGGAISGLDRMYFQLRGIADSIRITQFELISYAVAFFGQAIIGSIRQSGVPYINLPLAATTIKTFINLYSQSNKETHVLHEQTERLIKNGDKLTRMVEETDRKVKAYNSLNNYMQELQRGQDNVDSLISIFENGDF